MKPVSLTLEQLINQIQNLHVRGLLLRWMANHDMTMERLTGMGYKELKQQLGPKSIYMLYSEAWSFVSPDLPWMKPLQVRQVTVLAPKEVLGFPIGYDDVSWKKIRESLGKLTASVRTDALNLLQNLETSGEVSGSIGDIFPKSVKTSKRLIILFRINQRLQLDSVLFRFKFESGERSDRSGGKVSIIGRNM